MSHDTEKTTAVTMKPLAAWQKIDKGWLCVSSASKDLVQRRLSNDEFNRRYPVLSAR